MTRLDYLTAIHRAESAGFTHFAAALRVLMERDYPPSPAVRAVRQYLNSAQPFAS